MIQRIRKQVDVDGAPCGLCGHEGLLIERSRNRRRGVAWVNPWWKAQERTYRVCPECRARHRLIDGQPI